MSSHPSVYWSDSHTTAAGMKSSKFSDATPASASVEPD
jgi:hypothetical protein